LDITGSERPTHFLMSSFTVLLMTSVEEGWGKVENIFYNYTFVFFCMSPL